MPDLAPHRANPSCEHPEELPRHIAIIMDGNGRWAQARGLNRTAGHEEGARVARRITLHCNHLGIRFFTLYAFSTENWKRPRFEVVFLMRLLETYLRKELPTYLEHNVRLRVAGNLDGFSHSLRQVIEDTQARTAHCTNLTKILAINYGSRDEITRALRRVCEAGLPVSEENLTAHLDTAPASPVDLLIRTSGEQRLSNFLLWQAAHAQLHFTRTLWPDFSEQEFDEILRGYRGPDPLLMRE